MNHGELDPICDTLQYPGQSCQARLQPSPKMPADTVVEAKSVTIDGQAETSMFRFDGDRAGIRFLDYDVTNLAYFVRPGGRAAVIGVGATLGVLLGTRGSGSSSDGARAAIGGPPGPYRGSEPPPGIQAPDFSLRSYRGPLVRMRDLRGKVVLVTFLDTGCRDKCPIIAAAIGHTLPLLKPAERAQVDVLAVSVLPQLDTPPRCPRDSTTSWSRPFSSPRDSQRPRMGDSW